MSLNEDILHDYWHVAAERQRIYYARLRGDPPPWTEDPVISAHRFTNAYRAADRVSQYLIRLQYAGPQDPVNLFLRTALFRFFNLPEAWEEMEATALGDPLSVETFDPQLINSVLSARMARGERLFNAAYMIRPIGVLGAEKHIGYIALVENMLKGNLPARIHDAHSLRQVYELIEPYRGMGPFMAFQLVTDLNYSTMLDFDEDDYIVPGSGALRGIAKVGFDGRPEDAIRWAVDNQEAEFERHGLDWQNLFGRRLHLIDCQSMFCEVDKYARAAHPDVVVSREYQKIKNKYNPSARHELPEPFFPPKWGINNRVGEILL